MSDASQDPLICANDLACTGIHGDALAGVSFLLNPGDIAALVASPRSAGGLLLHCLGGLLRLSAGSLTVAGAAPSEWTDAHRRRVVFVRGMTRFPFGVRVRELLAQIGQIMEDPDGPDRALQALQLTDMADLFLHRLNPEAQQMARVACSLVGAPDVMLYESLFQNLSHPKADIVRSAIAEFGGDRRTVVFLADELQPVEDFCNCVIVLARGRLKACANSAALLEAHGHGLRVAVETAAPLDQAGVCGLSCVTDATQRGGLLEVSLAEQPDSLYELIECLRSQNAEIRRLSTLKPSLLDAAMAIVAESESAPDAT